MPINCSKMAVDNSKRKGENFRARNLMTRLSLSFLQLIQRPSCTAEGPRLASTGWCVIKHLLKGIDFIAGAKSQRELTESHLIAGGYSSGCYNTFLSINMPNSNSNLQYLES